EIARDALADQLRAGRGLAVLFGRTARARGAQLGVVVLEALALAHRIVGEHDEPLAGEVGSDALARLAEIVVAHGNEDRGQAARRARGQVDVRGHRIPGQALVHDVLDREAFGRAPPGHARLQWRLLGRQAA